mmetsp:Transcript_18695/g.46535  ORF Transcript_18695/g.46535 Transcript_18695/m.46535 type:complete len:174 (+) Transcript_18695:112-633(+)
MLHCEVAAHTQTAAQANAENAAAAQQQQQQQHAIATAATATAAAAAMAEAAIVRTGSYTLTAAAPLAAAPVPTFAVAPSAPTPAAPAAHPQWRERFRVIHYLGEHGFECLCLPPVGAALGGCEVEGDSEAAAAHTDTRELRMHLSVEPVRGRQFDVRAHADRTAALTIAQLAG